MRLLRYHPVLAVLMLALPAGALAATAPAVPYPAGLAAVIVWLGGLGWGFQTMLHHRLAAEDRLARLESTIACERDAHVAREVCTRQRLVTLETEWAHLEACLREGDLRHVGDGMRAVQQAIALLQEGD
jgi:hypothetical protein